jgi:hypothetical protein
MGEQCNTILLLAAAVLLPQAAASADVIRCSDAGGNTLYTDSPCPAGMHRVHVTSLPQPCTTEECMKRRERDLKEGSDRVRAEKEQLAAYAAERRKRELEDRWLDVARYEAAFDAAALSQAPRDEPIYPVYPEFWRPLRCGLHCFSSPHRHGLPNHGTNGMVRARQRVDHPGTQSKVRAIAGKRSLSGGILAGPPRAAKARPDSPRQTPLR